MDDAQHVCVYVCVCVCVCVTHESDAQCCLLSVLCDVTNAL